MLFRNKPQDVCCSETRHKMYVVQKQDTRYVLFRNKPQDVCCSETRHKIVLNKLQLKMLVFIS